MSRLSTGRAFRLLAWICLVVATSIAATNVARADDLADEADLQFQLGADSYREADYRGALEHFLASNRLVPNRNVGFNIARCYEQLQQYPAAFRYYTQALEGEQDPQTRGRVEAAIDKIKSHVAVIRIVTEPPGATVYIDRRDLGPRGSSPRTLGLAPGKYKVIAELPNYEPAESAVIEAPLGGETVVSLKLVPKLEGLTGNLVVNADERGALIEVDGHPRAFTPAIVNLPAGAHVVRISLKGFRAIEQSAVVRPNDETKLDVVLTRAEEVNAASRSTETVEDAPSSVSIVRSEELRGMGYPTIAEALRGVRGVYVSDDRSYAAVGFRGLGRLGNYGNRVLVLLDGQPTNDNWIGSSYVGNDARTDLEDIERIEVVRGPGSVLYGTNAFSGVINLVTRDVGDKNSGEAGVGASEYGTGRGRARANLKFGNDARLWMSVAAAKGAGRDFYFPEYADVPVLAGNARDIDGFKASTVNGRFTYKSLTAMWLLHSRNKWVPSGAYRTIFGDPRLQQSDTRGLVEVRFEPQLSSSVQIMSRVHANLYAFRGTYPYTDGLERDTFDGTWFGLEQRVVITPSPRLRLTLGGEAQFHTQVHETAEQAGANYLDADPKYQIQAAYLLADIPIGNAVRLSAGSRLDHYSTFGSSNNPRIALIIHPYDGGNIKIMGGKAFRAPSIYELSYNDRGNTQIASPDLKPESIYSAEIEYSHRFSPTVSASLSSYGTVVDGLILARGEIDPDPVAMTPGVPLYYVNSTALVMTLGGEVEVRRDWRQGWMLSASYSAQHSRYVPSTSLSDLFGSSDHPDFRRVPNAPEHLASFRGAVPILSRALLATTRISIEGPRFDRYEKVDDAVRQRSTDAAVVWDFVLSGDEPRWGLRYSLGLYNVFDWRYSVPVSNEFKQTTIIQNGRTVLATANVTF
jgi:outer membrane receptor protein involved in Fe transport